MNNVGRVLYLQSVTRASEVVEGGGGDARPRDPLSRSVWEARLEALAAFGRAALVVSTGRALQAAEACDACSLAFARFAGLLRLLHRRGGH